MSQPIITGIMSYGMSGKVFHAPFIQSNTHFQLRGVTERTTKKVKEVYPDVISYDTIEELLADPKIELVIVNTPNNTHYEFAKKALEAGKHIVVEKPFAASSEEAMELFELGRSKGLRVLVYQNRRWDSDFNSVKSVLESGKLGTLIEIHFRYDRYRSEISKKSFKELPLPASGLTYDLGPHLVDQVISMLGKPESFHKSTGIFRKGSQVDDYVNFHFKYPGSLNVFGTASLLTAAPLPAFVIHGTKGTYIKVRADVQEDQLLVGTLPTAADYGIEKEGAEGQLTTINDAGKTIVEYIPSLKGNYSRLFDAIYNTIRKDVPYPITENDIMLQMQILESK
ncbi:Oxidoreductase [Arcticibacter svalbardensis MN12-7]|uniref:Oxidoreductase n=1 Tax=Arcticibacter svalbardensis MN12-7 TaxID=1150600 RepID=R9GU44_9SPHI|nr:Gfo/Idh/MocA family oxidoreductase [Arcticibacter svalbardensis]EOR95382.1 Oxidoreductase [Arcticibacter svalbardensis MN12-7]